MTNILEWLPVNSGDNDVVSVKTPTESYRAEKNKQIRTMMLNLKILICKVTG